jgi:hypothetical protein
LLVVVLALVMDGGGGGGGGTGTGTVYSTVDQFTVLLINLQFLPYPSESIIHQPFYIRRHT